ncbi:hypothetical protein HOA64_03430 [bacterium]|nr:hypothetical protein [bacterium]MBT6832079.1 hypothetical protein [bacterium]MBT7772615.1 hypothetical protein [bacterium]
MEFFPANSFLAKRFAIFEELFDAPSKTLLALKDTLEARELRNGNQKFAMQTEIIIACTNLDPEEIAEKGDSYEALIQRFPLRLEVSWSSHEQRDYLEFFEKVDQVVPGPVINGMAPILADMIARAGKECDRPISPRVAKNALKTIKSSALMRGSEKVEEQDFVSLQFVKEFKHIGNDIENDLRKKMEEARARAEAESKLVELEDVLAEMLTIYNKERSPIKLGQWSGKFTAFLDIIQARLTNLPDGLQPRRKKMRETCEEMAQDSQQKCLEAINVPALNNLRDFINH